MIDLGAERTRLAYERTLMAWVRTATSLISFGFTVYKFFHEFGKTESTAHPASLFGSREFGLVMISIGLAALIFATIQHVHSLRALQAEYGELPRSVASWLAVLVASLGILALLAVVFRQ